jgi:hypothetical protein
MSEILQQRKPGRPRLMKQRRPVVFSLDADDLWLLNRWADAKARPRAEVVRAIVLKFLNEKRDQLL